MCACVCVCVWMREREREHAFFCTYELFFKLMNGYTWISFRIFLKVELYQNNLFPGSSRNNLFEIIIHNQGNIHKISLEKNKNKKQRKMWEWKTKKF